MENNQSNSENIGMTGDSFEGSVKGGSDSKEFFDQLENEVNGGIVDDAQVTQDQKSGSEQVTHEIKQEIGSESSNQSESETDWEKRYADSSREANKWRDQYKEVEQFVPVLHAMKNDSGLVDHVRDYLTGGGKPAKSIKEQLELDEDFVFDQQEAMENPDSDSAKLMNAHVDGLVQQRVGSMINNEKKRAIAVNQAKQMQLNEAEFRKKNKMSDEEFSQFKEQAQKHTLTLDDVHFLLNKDKVANNVAQSTQKEMLNQMKNVQNMPTSASSANSQKVEITQDRQVFENLLDLDEATDNMFG